MTRCSEIRPAAVAGVFYPRESAGLRSVVLKLLAGNPVVPLACPPKALIVPHAGYVYSGPIAARAYNALGSLGEAIRRVVLLGPAHRIEMRGLALPAVEAFQTPLGNIRLDPWAVAQLETLPQVGVSDEAHELEHSLEVQLPFLQMLLREFTLVPVVVGRARPEEVAEVLEKLWDGKETLVVISSDLSHYHPSDQARQLDETTAWHIENLQIPILEQQACGANPINGLLRVARKRKLQAKRLDLRNSGDTAGTTDRVVGYGSWAFYEI